MVKIKPFNGLIYNKEKIKKIDNVMSPPYDIISEDMQNEFHEKNPYNFIRLTLGKIKPGDTDENNRYTRAKKYLSTWIQDSILIKDDKPSIYPYKIKYDVKNQTRTMNGFFTLLKLDSDYKTVKAHEKTLSKPKQDRLNLLRQCKANLEPILLLYMDKNDEIRKKIDSILNTPIFDVKGYDGFNHRLWNINDEKIISYIQDALKDKILFIADGHHRYQTAINYANEIKQKKVITDDNAPFNYRMVILVNLFDEGLAIFPTHRLIKKSDIKIKDFISKVKEFFYVEEKTVLDPKNIHIKIKKDLDTKKEHKFALYSKNRYYILTLKDEKIMDRFANNRSKTWRTLDVSILHKIILEHYMGINTDNLEDFVKYTRMDEEAIKFVDDEKYDFSFLMNPTRIEELKSVAESGEHMPQKSTYFLPKMLSGLVMYKMW